MKKRKYQVVVEGKTIFINFYNYNNKPWLEITPHYKNKGFYFKHHIEVGLIDEWLRMTKVMKKALLRAKELCEKTT